MVVMVVSREVKQDDGFIPTEFATTLEKFQDIMPNETPKQLPPMRDVQHAIDFVPGSTLPNLSYFRRTPTENEELTGKFSNYWTGASFEKVLVSVLFWFYLCQKR